MTVINTASIPGKITMEEAVRLATLAKGRTVLQIGGYCGKGTLALAATAEHVWLVDDFSSYGDRGTVMQQICHTIGEAGPEVNGRVDWVRGDTSDLTLSAPLPACDMAYIDADRDPELIAQDLCFTRRALTQDSLLVFHENGKMIEQRIEAGYLVGAARC